MKKDVPFPNTVLIYIRRNIPGVGRGFKELVC